MASSNSESENFTEAQASPLVSNSTNQFLPAEFYLASSSSAPNSEVNVKQRVATLELLNQVKAKLVNLKSVNMALKTDLKPLVSRRGGFKARVTIILKGLKDSNEKSELNLNLFKRQELAIKEFFDKINKVEDEIEEVYDQHGIEIDEEERANWREESYLYKLQLQTQLAAMESSLLRAAAPDAQDLASAASKVGGNPLKIKLTCSKFNGGAKDRLNFKNWWSQFKTMLDSCGKVDGKYKLSVLRSHLEPEGLAFKLIGDLALTDSNYAEAEKVLLKEYLDVNRIRDELFHELLNKVPKFESNFEGVRIYVAEIKATMHDLKESYSTDFVVNSAGYLLISSVVFHKLPFVLQKPLMTKVNSNYPTLTQIFDNISNVITVLTKPNINNKLRSDSRTMHSPVYRPHKPNTSSSTLETFATSLAGKTNKIYCKFCDSNGNFSCNCTAYKTLEQRKTRCSELRRCFKCLSSTHMANQCSGNRGALKYPCKNCSSGGHTTAMCHQPSVNNASNSTVVSRSNNTIVDVCFSSGLTQSPQLLPVICIRLRGHNGDNKYLNFLFDTGSQRSYLSNYALNQLNCKSELMSTVEYEVKTFLGSAKKTLKQLNLDVFYGRHNYHSRLMLVDDDFDISFKIKGLGNAISNLVSKGCNLAALYKENSDDIKVHGLLGVDVIQHLKSMRMISVLNGSAWELPCGIIPFGNIQNFLYPEQITAITAVDKADMFSTIVSKYNCPSTLVNFVLNPRHSYEDLLETFFDESMVERGIDKMLSIESLGINESADHFSDYDDQKISEFKKEIELIDNSWHVKLVWHDNISKVQSGHQVALKVLDRVASKLEQVGKLNEYSEGFKKMLSDGVLEEIQVNPADYKNFIWIPHRPVFKSDEQATTKMRPVFNCSLKSKWGTPSLNEASYAGVNLMGDMLELIMLFRTNKYVYLADIRKAFLMIKLKYLIDKNRFCFFMTDKGRLICYRFTTLLFGLNASPFILNYVLKHHASLYPNDECSWMLKNKFFVDNLVHTSNSAENLIELYKTSVERLSEGNFDLRACNSNCNALKEAMIKDNRFVEHKCETEKVLGYRYSTTKDCMYLAKPLIDDTVNTKRGVLSQISKVFDPLSVTSPVTVRGKTIMKDIWAERTSEDHWEEIISEKSRGDFVNLCKDLNQLHTLEFPRYTLSEDKDTDLYLFCDASKNKAYGFVCYGVQEGKSHFLLARPRVVPSDPKSLPTLELLSVFLAVKGLFSMLKTYSNYNINKIVIAVDAQVVLSWLLTDVVKTKNQLACNRIKDIHRMLKELKDKFKIPISFRYIPTAENPADLLTRGLSFEVFKKNLKFWLHGPEWLSSVNVVWPSSELNCLSSASKSIVLHTCIRNVDRTIRPIVPFENYAKFNKLVSVTARMIKAVSCFKFKNKVCKEDTLSKLWGTNDFHQCAKIHLFSTMQRQSFVEEIAYLKDPKGKSLPDLVNNLNLFFDKDGLLRSQGRIGKTTLHEYDLPNPILLAKDHPLTRLIIENCHRNCQHLGIGSTLNKVRLSGFWIPKIRQAVKNVISHCILCKRFNNLSFKYPKVTNLPKHRVNFIKPFKHTGIDYTSHVWVKDGKGLKKYYLLIFTCLNVRAIHIELIEDMSTHSLILALIRFCNIFGTPSHIYSDNAKSFVAGVNFLHEVFLSSEFNEKFSKFNIKHIRIPVYSAWVGSTWERMIRVIKSCLYKVVGRAKLTYFKLLTILSDIQQSINSRPLTYRCSDDSGLEGITPNCFIRPNANANLLFKACDKNVLEADPPSRSLVNKSIAIRDSMLEHFKQIWYDEYLLSLREQCKNLHQINFVNKINVDDVVLVRGPSHKKRPHWILGRVLELVYGDDDNIRSVKLKRGDGVIQHHSISHLYPMELSLTHHFVTTDPSSHTQENVGATDEEIDNPVENLVDSIVEPEIDQEIDSVDVGRLDQLMAPDAELVEPDIGTGMDHCDSSYGASQSISSIENVHDSVHPSGRLKRKIIKQGRPLDNQFLYYD